MPSSHIIRASLINLFVRAEGRALQCWAEVPRAKCQRSLHKGTGTPECTGCPSFWNTHFTLDVSINTSQTSRPSPVLLATIMSRSIQDSRGLGLLICFMAVSLTRWECLPHTMKPTDTYLFTHWRDEWVLWFHIVRASSGTYPLPCLSSCSPSLRQWACWWQGSCLLYC